MYAADRMAIFTQQMHDAGLTIATPLRGCSNEEIRRLESRYKIALPDSYRCFLATMGNSAGDLGSEQLLYPAVYDNTADERATCHSINSDIDRKHEDRRFFLSVKKLLRRYGLPVNASAVPDPVHYTLPDDGLIIFAEFSLPTFWMIRCVDPQDSPIYSFDYEGWSIELRRDYDSVYAFLEMLLAEARGQLRTR